MASGTPAFAWYGDDFTGASDTLATLAQAGLRTRLFLDVPSRARLAACGPLDAIGIAGATRAMAPEAIATTLAPVGHFFIACGAPVIHYKVCSTFDSAIEIGNIATAVETLHASIGGPLVLIVGGQPSLGRYCAFGQLFAADAAGVIHRIDRHPTMRCHPVTPMHEAELRLHLGAQGLTDVALLDWRTLEAPASSLDAELDRMIASRAPGASYRSVLVDVLTEAHVTTLGRLITQYSRSAPLLAVGASSVAAAVIDARCLPRKARDGRIGPAQGPVFVLAGSLSPQTACQIEAARSYQRIPLDAGLLVRGEVYLDTTVATIAAALDAGRHVLAHTTPIDGACSEAGSPALARSSGELVCRVLALTRVQRIGIAGGDTSSAVVQALAPCALSWVGRAAPGVAVCRIHADDPRIDGVELMLKGGQMGAPDLFERLVLGSEW